MTVTPEPLSARILGAQVHRPGRRDSHSHIPLHPVPTPSVAVMVDRRLKTQKVDTVHLTAVEAVALATDLLVAAAALERAGR